MIYTEVLGGRTLHIVRKRQRLGFLSCRGARREDCPTHACQGSVDGDGVWTGGFSGKERTDGGLLDLTLVSRRVYVAPFFPPFFLPPLPLHSLTPNPTRDPTPHPTKKKQSAEMM